MVSPCPGRAVTTGYGRPGSWCGGKHGGVDFAAPTGATVVAAWPGTVTDRTWGSSFGTQVVINQDPLPDGRAGGFAVYAHLSRKSVAPGQRVAAGQQLGAVGATGNATGPHLHYEVQPAGTWACGAGVDPRPWLDADPSPSPPPVDWLIEGVLPMSVPAIVFFTHNGTQYEAAILAGTYRAYTSGAKMTARRDMLKKLGIPFRVEQGSVANPAAYGRRVQDV